jgi:hypothetical protein
MKVKVSETEGETLSYLVGRVMGFKPGNLFRPSADWAQGGPIVEREKIGIVPSPDDASVWIASMFEPDWGFNRTGPTPLIAAMRCYVAGQLGEEVEVPDEFSSN